MEDHVRTMDPCMIMNGQTMGPCNKTVTPGMGTSTTEMPGMNMGSMNNYFHWGYNETVLFWFWTIDSVGGLIGSMIGIFIAGVVYEGLKTFRNIVVQRSFKSRHKKNGNKFRLSLFFDWKYVLLSVLHGVLLSLSYSFMLVFMTYNVWLTGAVVFGMSVGYFFFGWLHSATADIC